MFNINEFCIDLSQLHSEELREKYYKIVPVSLDPMIAVEHLKKVNLLHRLINIIIDEKPIDGVAHYITINKEKKYEYSVFDYKGRMTLGTFDTLEEAAFVKIQQILKDFAVRRRFDEIDQQQLSSQSSRFSRSKLMSILLLVIFILAEYPFSNRITAKSEYAMYGFELIFVAIVFLAAKFKLFNPGTDQSPIQLKPYLPIVMGIFLVFGAMAYVIGKGIGLFIPFDFRTLFPVLLLLIAGPAIEELVFRGALWKVFGGMFNHPMFMIIASSALFSFSHYYATFSAPPEYHDFILYQTGYTFVLGMGCSFTRQLYGNKKGLLFSFGVHLCNNLGFWLASLAYSA